MKFLFALIVIAVSFWLLCGQHTGDATTQYQIQQRAAETLGLR